MQPRFAYQLLLNDDITTYDDFLERAEDIGYAAYYQTCEAGRELEGIDCHILDYPSKTAYPPMHVEFITVGYSEAKQHMVVSATRIHDWDVEQFHIDEPQICGRATGAIEEFEEKIGRYFTASTPDLMACLGCQAMWAEKQGHIEADIGGGEINILDIDKDRNMHIAVSGTMDDCIRYAKDMLQPKMSLVKSKKVGRNDKCPCGSGQKYKKCCG
jgi:hypothetical protein